MECKTSRDAIVHPTLTIVSKDETFSLFKMVPLTEGKVPVIFDAQ